MEATMTTAPETCLWKPSPARENASVMAPAAPTITAEPEKVLSVKDLKVYFPVKKGIFKKTVGHVKAVDGVSFDLFKGRTLGLVGESGCGKTTVAKALVKLVPAHQGQVICQDQDLLTAPAPVLRKLRKTIQMIFQDPFSSLDPKMTVGNIIGEAVKVHRPGPDVRKRVQDCMELTGLRREYDTRYPHEFSGGQRQRIGIARALATEPPLSLPMNRYRPWMYLCRPGYSIS